MKKIILAFILVITIAAFSQNNNPSKPPVNWQLMDWQQDGYPGMSVEKAYSELLKNKKPKKKIIIAIIDVDGFDNTHPDLQGVQWTNRKEIAGNGIDDDNNGFVDDIHGWNFGGNAIHETAECIREYVRLRSKYENIPDTISLANEPGYIYWKKVLAEKHRMFEEETSQQISYRNIIVKLQILQTYWSKELNSDSVTVHDISTREISQKTDSNIIKAHRFMKDMFMKNKQISDSIRLDSLTKGLQDFIDGSTSPAAKEADTLILKNDPTYYRKTELGDDPYINNGNHYGNNNTMPYAGGAHSTFIAGIIAATRNNGIGGNGITNSAEIMTIKMDGSHTGNNKYDEWDKDVANSIRYAIDNGAQIVNMSFGKYLSPQKAWVDEAMKYAEQKGVLLIAGAGNDHHDNDSSQFYPYAYDTEKKEISNLIKVGASTYDSSLVATFGNYGKNSVDVFAPGVNIYSTDLNGVYRTASGTSFATPMVAGLAALIWSYYPKLTYKQVKYCMEKSETPINTLVTKPGTVEKVLFSSLSRSGGIVNAYKAILIAEELLKKK